MKFWTLACIAASVTLIGLSFVFNRGAESLIALSTPLFVAGVTLAAITLTLWLARAFGLGRRSAKSVENTARIQSLMNELVECAADADTRGVMALSHHTLHDRQNLFAKGVELLLSAAQPANIRETLTSEAAQEAAAAGAKANRLALVCRVLPVAAIAAAVASIAWVVSMAGGVANLGPVAPIALLAIVYGAYVVSAFAIEVGDRASAAAAEKELTGSLVIETIVAISAGASANRVGSLLGGRLPSQFAPGHGIRQAA